MDIGDTITRTQTLTIPTAPLTLPRCTACDLHLPLHGDCPCQVAHRRLLWRGIRYGLAGSVILWGMMLGLLWWLGGTL